MKKALVAVAGLFIVSFAIEFASAPIIPIAIAQPAATDKPVLVQDTPKEAVPMAIVVTPPTIDPKSLIGEWKGEWSNSYGRDSVYLTIKNVDGEKFSGTVYIKGRASYHNRDLPYIGTLKDTTLSMSYGTIIFNFTLINDHRMEGSALANTRASIWLEKEGKEK